MVVLAAAGSTVDASGLADVDDVGATLRELVKPFAVQATLGWILNNRLPTPAHFRFHGLAKKIDNVVYRIIAERRAKVGGRRLTESIPGKHRWR